jgi:hypothetical protein
VSSMRSIGRYMTGRAEVYVKRSGAGNRLLYAMPCHPPVVGCFVPSVSEPIPDRDSRYGVK